MFYWPSGRTTPVYETFLAFDALYRRRCAVAAECDEPNVYVLAAKSPTAGEAIYICNIGRDAKDVALDVSGAGGSRFSVRRIDAASRALAPCGFHALGERLRLPPTSVTLLERAD